MLISGVPGPDVGAFGTSERVLISTFVSSGAAGISTDSQLIISG
jgi:hypothetical protein